MGQVYMGCSEKRARGTGECVPARRTEGTDERTGVDCKASEAIVEGA
jgi:hypothetical protein